MLSGYPPGVSGREYAIAGADSETEEPRECSYCGHEGMVLVERYRADAWFRCEVCDHQNEWTEEEDYYGPDPDQLYDEMRDREAESRA